MLEKEEKSKKRKWGIALFIIGWIIVGFGILGFNFWKDMGMGAIIAIFIDIPMIIVGFILVLIGVIFIIKHLSEDESRIISDMPELKAPLELSLRDKVEALITSPNKAKDFYISVQNRSPNLIPDVKVQLSKFLLKIRLE